SRERWTGARRWDRPKSSSLRSHGRVWTPSWSSTRGRDTYPSSERMLATRSFGRRRGSIGTSSPRHRRGPIMQTDPQAVLITGLFGTGKSSVAIEMADVLEKRELPYAVVDLDWLCWGWAGGAEGSEHRMMLANIVPAVANYREAGVRYLIFARSIKTAAELESLRSALSMPLAVVELIVSFSEIERRLAPEITAARRRICAMR